MPPSDTAFDNKYSDCNSFDNVETTSVPGDSKYKQLTCLVRRSFVENSMRRSSEHIINRGGCVHQESQKHTTKLSNGAKNLFKAKM